MKRAFTLLLTALLLFALAGCGPAVDKPETDSPEAPEATETATGEAVDVSLLWSALDGVWLADDGQFVMFSLAEGQPAFSTGILNSGYGLGGTLNTAGKTGENAYKLSIDFPAREDTMESEGWEAFTSEISLTTHLNDDPKTIDVAGLTLGGIVYSYTYAGKELKDAAEFTEPPAAESAAPMTQTEAWSNFGGIWSYKSDGLPRFAFFSNYDGAFTCGTLFSGDAVGGQLTSFTDIPSEKLLTFDVYSPAFSNMEGSQEEITFTVKVDYSRFDDGILSIATGSDGVLHECRYISRDFNGLGDIEHVLAQLPD